MRLIHYLIRLYINKLKKVNLRYLLVQDINLAKVIYELRLNSWNTKHSQNMTYVCKNILSVKQMLLECPITTELFQKNESDFNEIINDDNTIIYKTDIIV